MSMKIEKFLINWLLWQFFGWQKGFWLSDETRIVKENIKVIEEVISLTNKWLPERNMINDKSEIVREKRKILIMWWFWKCQGK